MNLIKANMWDNPATYTVITTNSYVKRNGDLVMGRGAALEASRIYPGCAKSFGDIIKLFSPDPYYLIACPGYHNLLAFQVKYNWWEDADLDLIASSARRLNAYARYLVPAASFAMNFPGIGNGRLHRNDVLPLLQCLPDNVNIYELPELP
jgi:hypothetical protein